MSTLTPVHTFGDLVQFGIDALTGESCAFSMRLLCDVNADGAALLADYLGLTTAAFQDNWNSTVNGQPAVGSVMLDRDCLSRLATFAAFRAGALAVVVGVGSVVPVMTPERLAEYTDCLSNHPELGSLWRNPTIGATQPHAGSRNVHAATGRTT